MTQRVVTLFVDIAGSTRLLVRHPPETAFGVVRCFMDLVSEVAIAHGGRVKDFEGDGVLLYFEAARRATEAALAIRASLDHAGCEAACDGGPGAPARMSITIGDVAVGTVGPPAARSLALVGPSVNVGARLLRVLPPGGIVVSGEVVADLRLEAPALAERFRLLDPAYEVPGADGLTVAIHALADAMPAPRRRVPLGGRSPSTSPSLAGPRRGPDRGTGGRGGAPTGRPLAAS